MACGADTDTVIADPEDPLDGLAALECENVDRASPPPDTQNPSLTLDLARSVKPAGGRILELGASISEPGTIEASGSIEIDGKPAGEIGAAWAHPDAPGQLHTLKLQLSRSQAKKVERGLRDGDPVTAALVVTAGDEAGNRATRRRTVVLR